MNKSVAASSTLVDFLRGRALEQPKRQAYSFQWEDGQEISVTYEELDAKARHLGACLQQAHGFGERALLLYQPSIQYIIAFFGCLYAGIVPVPAYPPRQNGNLARLQAVVGDAQASLALTTTSILAGIERRFSDSQELAALDWVATDQFAEDLSEQWQPPQIESDTLAFLQYTSGSTSLPKGVMLTHGNLLHNLELIQNSFGTSADSVCVIWLPPYHDMGLIGGILQPLYTGYPVTLMAPVDFITRPLRWLETISRTGATVSGGPNFAYELCLQKITPEQRDTLDLSKWEHAFTGAEPIRAETLERFAEFFAPCGFRREAFYPCYGLAEGTLFVSGGLKHEPPIVHAFQGEALVQNQVLLTTEEGELNRKLVSSGRPALSDQSVLIVDPVGLTSCSDDQVGEIWVSGPSVAQGYWKREEQTEETFRAYLADTGEGPFLRTGDLGFIHNGELYVTGRLKDLIIIRGRNYYPQDIEFSVQESHSAVGNSNGAAFSVELDGEERLVIVQELERQHRKGNHEDVVQEIRRAVSEQHQLQVYAVVLIKPASIPKTSSGKIQRHACKERFLNGTLEAVHVDRVGIQQEVGATVVEEEGHTEWAECDRDKLLALPQAERSAALQEHLAAKAAQVLRLSSSQVRPEQPLNTLGLDSLMAVELKNSIAENFGVDLPLASLLEGVSTVTLTEQVVAQMSETTVTAESAASDDGTVKTEFALTYGQRALWFLQRLAPDSTASNITRAVRVKSELDADLLQAALQMLVDRHPLLRTTFYELGGEPIQRVHERMEIRLIMEDAGTWKQGRLQERLHEETNRIFDLEQGPLLRMYLFVQAQRKSVLLFSIHHIIVDFWSLGVMIDELWTIYAALKQGEHPALAEVRGLFANYVQDEEQMLTESKGERLWGYWESQLHGAPPVLALPTDRPRPAVQTYNGAQLAFCLSDQLTQQLKALAKQRGVTMYTLLMTAFQTLLHRYSGQDDILVGSPTTGRTSSRYVDTVGYLINQVVVRGDFAGRPTFAALLEQMRHTVLRALDHQEYPFSLLVERLQPQRNPSYSPLIQVMFTLQKSHFPDDQGFTGVAIGHEGSQMTARGLEFETVAVQEQVSQMDLWLTMGEVEGVLTGSFAFNTDLFDQSTIDRLIGHFKTQLEGVVADPDLAVSDLPLMSDAERTQVLAKWNDTGIAYEADLCIHQLFEAQVERTPDRLAVVFEDASLSYRELDLRANQLAAILRQKGVGQDVLVGICMERSLEMMVGLLGILKAGGAYVPLDPTYPADRIAFILEDAQAPVLLTQPHLLRQLPEHQGETVLLDSTWSSLALESEVRVDSGVKSTNLAYMIYTSGSTGKPKGVMIEHRNATNFFCGMDQRIGCSEEDSILAVTSICFDISVLELFWTLVRGAKVVLLSEREAAGGLANTQAKKGNSGMEFSLFYFAISEQEAQGREKYRLLIEGAKYADKNGFTAVWTPERHFHEFGGLYPSPSVTAAALAMVTENIELRSGSVVLPLHHPIRVVEEWSVVDNLSEGRVALSFASGWHTDDFVLAPENYQNRSDVMFNGIETVQKLWQGEAVTFTGGTGQEVEVKTLPRPFQETLPVYITSGGSKETFRRAGEVGANLLTHLLGQTTEELTVKIAVYRQALLENGHDPQSRRVALMLHTYIGQDPDIVRETVREPFTDYLRSSFGLVENLVRSANLDLDLDHLSEEDRESILAFAFDRYFETSGLFGTPEGCLEMIDRLKAIGVDEIAALIDFGVPTDDVLSSLDQLNELRKRSERKKERDEQEHSLAEQAVAHQATMLQCTPSLMKILGADANKMAALQSLKTLMLGGEALSAKQAQELRAALPDARILNMYGPTEATVWATTYEVDKVEDHVPIGCPFANVRTFILDASLQPLPIGVAGELHIGGRGVARGYHNRTQLNEEKFIEDPYADDPQARLYKTGDLVQYLPDGNIKFLGRLDHQVKIRGFRIELGEIEKVLGHHPAVREVVVTDREDIPGDTYLAAYLVSQADQTPTDNELRTFLQAKLPNYMIPSAFVLLERLPLTPNGKIDRKALPDPKQHHSQRDVTYVAPCSQIEQQIAKIWQDVLRVEKVGLHDNFFEIGGHSLLATKVLSLVRNEYRIELELQDLFRFPTLASLATCIEQKQTEQPLDHAEPVPVLERLAVPMVLVEGESPEPVVQLPVSFAQRRMWFLDQLQGGHPVYNLPGAVRLQGHVHLLAMEQSFASIIMRHEVLRSSFRNIDGELLQIVRTDGSSFVLQQVDLMDLPQEMRETRAFELAVEEAKLPFSLERGPVFRATLVKLDDQDHLLLITFHHIVSDGWSTALFIREWASFYAAFVNDQPAQLPELSIQYADYSNWQEARFEAGLLEKQLPYWKDKLGGELPLLQMPTDHPRPSVQRYQGSVYPFKLPSALTAKLQDLSQQSGVTLFMTLLAGFKTLLHRYSGQDDLLVGTPVANRNREEIEGMIGFFANTLVLRTDLSGNPTFRNVLERVKETTLGAYSHQDVPFEKLVEELQPTRDTSYTPLFQVMFALQAPMPELKLSELTVHRADVHNGTSKFDLTLYLEEIEGDLTGTLEFNTDLFEVATVERFTAHFIQLLENIVEQPSTSIGELALLGEAERQQLLVDWNNTFAAHPETTLTQLFEAQSSKTPDAVALVDGEERLTFAELNRRANQMAYFLQKRGVGVESRVGVCMDRSTGLVVTLLGILKAGAAYVPLDPNYPADRILFTLEDADVTLLLTEERLISHLGLNDSKTICMEQVVAELAQESGDNLLHGAEPHHLAYLIYTSGSTGRPKGVAIEHHSASELVHWAKDIYSPEEYAGVLFSTSICFDLSIFELFVPLSWGGKVILAENALRLSLLPAKEEVTLINTVPSAISELLQLQAIPANVKIINLAGEPLKKSLVEALYAVQTIEKVYNLYGPSEDTTYSTFALMSRTLTGNPLIGRPLTNTKTYVLNPQMQPVPIGVAGELYIGGKGLAREYLNRPDLTAEKFIANPFVEGTKERLYRTNDLVRCLPDGSLDYLGRIDHQVKVRGYRIELGEIEAVLGEHPSVRESVVIVREDQAGDQRIVAYVVVAGDPVPTSAALRQVVKKRLPEYMVPSALVHLSALPLTPNGKVDRKALPVPEVSRLELHTEFVAPRTTVEQQLAVIWSQLLGVEQVGIHDNFFNLGGHSLLAAQMITRIRSNLHVDIPMLKLFEMTTIAELANLVEAEQQTDQVETPAITRRSRSAFAMKKGE